MQKLIVSLLAFALTGIPSMHSAYAWGQDGHRITAEIGWRNLNPKAREAIRKILGEEHLAELSTWADEIRSEGSWDFIQPWHFMSIDDDESFEGYEHAEEGDVMVALKLLEAFLKDSSKKTLTLKGPAKKRSKVSELDIGQTKEIDKRQALALYVHFVGDIHQPLHVGRRDDRGGNRIQVEWFGEETNIHKVWDESLIESTNLSYTEFSTFLNRFSDEDRKKWQQSTYLDWAKESKEIRPKVYDFGAQRSGYFLNITTAPTLSYDYRSKTLPIVRDRLRLGGVRLAGKLNEIFGGKE